jgi:hypothetical protein
MATVLRKKTIVARRFIATWGLERGKEKSENYGAESGS